jgi:hypothetical protein
MLVLLLSIAPGLAGQSLGDVARASREKKKDKTAPAAKRVVTNDDIPSSPEANVTAAKREEKKAAISGKPSAEEWKSRILEQKKAIATLQTQIDKVSQSIYFVVADEYYNGVEHNQHQVKKQDLVDQLRQRLEEEKTRLSDIQEEARQAGMGSSVYDP